MKTERFTLEDIAHLHRCRFTGPVIAVAGSNGKTTTKEMLAHVLFAEFKTVKARDSFNISSESR